MLFGVVFLYYFTHKSKIAKFCIYFTVYNEARYVTTTDASFSIFTSGARIQLGCTQALKRSFKSAKWPIVYIGPYVALVK